MSAKTQQPQTSLQVSFDPGSGQDVGISLDERARKRARAKERVKERSEDRIAYERLGVRALRIRASTYRMLKAQISELGVNAIGHCTIMIAREKAESVVAELDAIAQQWDRDGVQVEPEARVGLQQLKLDCIKVMMESGAEHLKAERSMNDQQSGKGVQLPFEAGVPTAVIFGNPTPKIEGDACKG